MVVPVSSVASCLSSGASGTPKRERLGPAVAVVLHLDDQLLRQRVDDGRTDAVQTAGDLVAAAPELAAGVQLGQHQGHRRDALGVGAGRDAAAVVDHPHAAVGQQGDHDLVAVAGQRLVDRVVDDLGDEVVQSALPGRADVHARALADGLESLEDADLRRVVHRLRGAVRVGQIGGFEGNRLDGVGVVGWRHACFLRSGRAGREGAGRKPINSAQRPPERSAARGRHSRPGGRVRTTAAALLEHFPV